MDKSQLQKIFSTEYNHENWLNVLKQVFGARQLLMQPKSISLASNDITEDAFELGNITTSDDRIIGLYKIDVKGNVWLERNKVGLRKLLRDVYQYDVDGALIVFVQDKKWRLSFVSEVKVLNDEGEIVKEVTEPKRYTYLLGEGEKTQTPSIFLSKLSGKVFSLEDIRKSFSVDILNEEFYKIIQQKFYELIGGKIGTSKKQTDFGNGKLALPGITKEARQIHQEFAVRLIGRTVFCWFLKMKKESNGEPLISEALLSSKAVKANKSYYHSILERLFFQTLNTPMDERLGNLPNGCEKVPFLNGGLFEPGVDDFYRFNKLTGLSEYINTLVISDEWFVSFFEELEKYNFTIDENSVTDVEVSVDPEMLGRIFENLLAEIDPDSGETARKATGSFYTPREIVDYMAIESLVQYIHNKTSISHDRLRDVFKMSEKTDLDFEDFERIEILKALDEVKILDPACGSGAFPMGVLQKIVVALQKLDKNAEWWIQQRINENKNTTARKAVKEKLEGNSQYARKIGIIQNSLYGVDIQPIAAEISKLRCFLTLVVDERIDDSKSNRGIDPLPNLEFKFVTANTLLNLPDQNIRGGLFDHFEELEELEQLRIDYLQSSGKEKQKIKERFPIVQKKIFKEQLNLFVDTESRAYKLSTWDPFGHDKADWFDPKWMYGVEKFDVVIGNPPYLRVQGLDTTLKNKYQEIYKSAKGAYDLYILFTERGLQLLSESGILNYIQPDKWINGALGKGLREITAPHLYKLISFKHFQVFNATTYSSLLWLTKKKNADSSYGELDRDLMNNIQLQNWLNNLTQNDFTTIHNSSLSADSWSFAKVEAAIILSKINKHHRKAKDIFERIFTGLQTSLDDVYFISNCEIDEKYIYGESKALQEKVQIEIGLVKKILKGDNVQRFETLVSNTYVIFPYTIQKIQEKETANVITQEVLKAKYPKGWEYLSKCAVLIKNRENGKLKNLADWYRYIYPKNLTLFDKRRLVCRDICQKSQFTIDENGEFCQTTTVYGYIKKQSIREDYRYLLAILNSQLTWYFMVNTAAVLANGYYRYMPRYISEFPIPETSATNELPFICLVDYILFLKKLPVDITVNDHVPNSHIIQLFEEVIDALVYELYFEDDFKKAGIEFMKYAQRDFTSIEGKGEKETITIIQKAYQTLREKDNEIRNNLKLMDIKLAELIMPIKTAK